MAQEANRVRGGAAPTRLKPPPVPESPYRGIESFRYIDQQIFVARADETWELLSSVIIYRGVLLYGDSGSGKSSLVNAGLLPAALRKNFRPERLRVQPWPGRELKVERIPLEFADRPPYLPSTFVEPGSRQDEELSVELSLEEFRAGLERLRPKRPAPGEAGPENSGPDDDAPAPPPTPLLVFDQFEEFSTLFEEAARAGRAEESARVQRSVLGALSRLLEDDELPVKLLFVFREDYLAKLNTLLGSRPELLDQAVRLLPPRTGEAADIIRAPFADDTLRESFLGGARARKEITPALAADIAAQLQERAEGGFTNLSELQIVCQKLWESSDPAAFYERAGRSVQKVIEGYWADAFEKLPAELHDPAVALLGRMVTSAGTRNIVSEFDLVPRGEEEGGFGPDLVRRALEALCARRLVHREPRHNIYFYEIASEFLVPWIQKKQADRLTRVEADRLAAGARLKLEQAERARRRLRYGGLALAVALAGAVLLAFYMSKLQQAAVRAQADAELARSVVELRQGQFEDVLEDIAALKNQDAARRVEAVQHLAMVINNGGLGSLNNKIAAVIFPIIAEDKDPQVSQAAAVLLPAATKGADEVQTVAILAAVEQNSMLAPGLPPRAYIKLASEGQRPRADKIAAALKELGFAIPPVEVRCCSPRNELRYHEPTGRADHDALLKVVDDADRGSGRWELRSLGPSGRARPGHFEVWFAKDATPATPTPPPATPQPTPTQVEPTPPPPGETFSYGPCRFSRWEILTAEQVNARLGRQVYAPSTQVIEGELAADVVLARVHKEKDQVGDLLINPRDIESLTPEQIKDRFALYITPRFVSEARVRAGTRMRIGTANRRPGLGEGGGVRFQFLGVITRANFPSEPRPLQ